MKDHMNKITKGLPRSRQEILKWVRIYFNIDPVINNAVRENVAKLGQLQLGYDNQKQMKFYNDMAYNEKFDLNSLVYAMALSYFRFGEAIMFGNMNEGLKRWGNVILLEPELVEITTSLQGEDEFSLWPTEELKAGVKDGSVNDPTIIKAVFSNTNIPLDNNRVSLIANYTDASATRGTSPIQCVFSDLMYLDSLRAKKQTPKVKQEITDVLTRIKNSLDMKSNMQIVAVREKITRWLTYKYFQPVARLNKLKALPQIMWNKY